MSAVVLERRKRLTALIVLGVIAGMAGVSLASAPLYRLYCQVTGYGGTTRIATADSATSVAEMVTVRFNADVGRGMPWAFFPSQSEMRVRIGETNLTTFVVENPTARTITGTATFNVTPDKVGPYFAKLACFCFEDQTLAPGARAELPVSFFVDPAMLDDPNMKGVGTITLSYTFFERETE
ncbi:MAG: cytochrome c oxidase assembly protein [Alphaproteobacteria bacterium]|nr:cytochrome c oxidase assembly protein [Alphaproteobacteria bacterium]